MSLLEIAKVILDDPRLDLVVEGRRAKLRDAIQSATGDVLYLQALLANLKYQAESEGVSRVVKDTIGQIEAAIARMDQ